VFGLPLNKFTNQTVALTIYGAITNYLGYQKQHRPHPLVSFIDDIMSLLLITHDEAWSNCYQGCMTPLEMVRDANFACIGGKIKAKPQISLSAKYKLYLNSILLPIPSPHCGSIHLVLPQKI